MRLYLSSYQMGACPDSLLSLMGNGKRAAVISNALDHIPARVRKNYRRVQYDPIKEFRSLGIDAVDLDLRDYFNRPDKLKAQLSRFDLVWATGGNAFLLLRAMAASGFTDVIKPLLDGDNIVYGGFSAGAVVATPSLRGLDCMDPPTQIPDGYDPEIIWDGLALVEFSIVPHYASKHPESESADRAVDGLRAMGMQFVALKDGDVIIQNGTTPYLYREGSEIPISNS